MKLLRYGNQGEERPGLLDMSGTIRNLSAHVEDITGAHLAPTALAKLRALDPQQLPVVSDDVRLGPCVGAVSTTPIMPPSPEWLYRRNPSYS